jgi:hypothetical protein
MSGRAVHGVTRIIVQGSNVVVHFWVGLTRKFQHYFSGI